MLFRPDMIDCLYKKLKLLADLLTECVRRYAFVEFGIPYIESLENRMK